ncbi:MAG: GHKL domain-containing protein [Gammaproteobacteria bacterium]|nr:GHKL domain-containing protein [Gammaproteobacteria bacterium]MBT4078693.1 GHKL domain-containing protein [Gammaproteobacteria bacterium]MBT6457490.1 GHKL domain-containing protein [Gammaproteobacteria bacterium]MBT6550522.1 GHKL domain-containing protein [Gammaproteobacteria bacterium]MBT6701054.1 GHKL domain-containing protein [Gammaproteobacteria bacterium]
MIKSFIVTLCLVILYWSLWHSSSIFEYAPYASLWFAPSGLAVAILLLWNRDGFVKVWICVWFVSMQTQFVQYGNVNFIGNLTVSSSIAFGFTIPYWLAVRSFLKIEHLNKETATSALLRPILFPLFLLAGSLGAATLGILSLISFGDLTVTDGKSIWLAWWIGDFVGVILLAPIFVLLGYRFLKPWIEPENTLLVQNASNQKAFSLDMVSLISILMIILLPSIIAIARAELDERIPIIFSFFLALLSITILTARNTWTVILITTVLSSLSIIITVKYFSVRGDGIAYQTTLLAIAITSYYFYDFVKSFTSNTQQLVEMERSLGTASRLLTLNELSTNIAHELSTPLQTALIASQRVRRRLQKIEGDWSVEKTELTNIKLAIEQASKTIDSVRNLVKSPGSENVCCSLQDTFEITLKLIESAAHEDDVEINISDLSKLPPVAIGQNELIQVFLNLINNSISSLSEVTNKKISISAIDSNYSEIFLQISDSGRGIGKHLSTNLFKIGTSQSDDGLGLGLGLWVSRSIAERRGGSLDYINESNTDSFFQLTLKTAKGIQ